MMRELRVEDALLYLDQVKVEFGDRPHIYNEFLDIMKTFKTQQIDTPGVIRRVSNLFQGNKKLVLGFNTFLPEGYKIELPLDGDGPPIAVFRAPGETVGHIISGPGGAGGPPPGAESQAGQHQQPPGGASALARAAGPPHQPPHRPGQALVQPPTVHAPGRPLGVPGAPSENPPAYAQQPGMHMVGGPRGETRGQVGQMPPSMLGSAAAAESAARARMEQQARNGAGPPIPGRGAHSALERGPPHAQGMPTGRAAGMPLGQPQPSGIESNAPPRHPPSNPNVGNVRYPVQHSAAEVPMQPSAPAPAPQQPLEFDHAINYVTTIKKRFANEPETYKKFLEILHTYQKEQRGIKEVLEEVSTLFSEHPDLLKEFTYFLPDNVQAEAKAQLDIAAKAAEARNEAKRQAAARSAALDQGALSRQQQQQQQPTLPPSQPPPVPPQQLVHAPIPQPREAPPPLPPPPAPPAERNAVVRTSYPAHPIPFGATQGRSKERERDISRSVVYGTISFAPARPPRKNALSVTQSAAKNGRPTMIPPLPKQPTTAETLFFDRAKKHLNRKELAPDKPHTGSKVRHTPYAEFLKCLHLFGAGILNKDELILLCRGLFMQGHAPKSGANAGGGASHPQIANDAQELLKEFEEVMISRGPYADQEMNLKNKSKYGAKRARDFDLRDSDRPTPSYAAMPTDYPSTLFYSHTGQTDNDLEVLNDKMVCVGAEKLKSSGSPEDYDAVKVRKNAYEEAMFRIEDERFEMDMAIERNALAMRKIEPIAEEITMLRENEEKDGQPIGRLKYRLNPRSLNSIHINAIGRIYGDKGDEVIEHLVRNPLAATSIIYQRLRQKDQEWRKQKIDRMPKWKAACEANYEGSFDFLCYGRRKEVERSFSADQLREECMNARTFCSSPEKRTGSAVSFGLSSPDRSAVLYEPYAVVEMKPQCGAHQYAVSLIKAEATRKARSDSHLREKIGRIWAEFLIPFFDYPVHWVAEEVRDSYCGQLGELVVQYAIGQRVRTSFGDGTILALNEGDATIGPRYRIKFDFGTGFISPSCIMHGVGQNDGPKYVRRNGVMRKEKDTLETNGGSVRIDNKFKLLFGTENIYLLIRLFSFLVNMLEDVESWISANPSLEAPSSKYYNPIKGSSSQQQQEEKKVPQLDFKTLIAKLQRVVSKDMPLKDFESYCRSISKSQVHKMAALPKLVERCADMLIQTSDEDLVLQLFDYCQFTGADPVQLRTTCLGLSPDTSYRIQYNTTNGRIYFSYLPENEELSTVPGDDDDDDDDDGMEDGEVESDMDDDDEDVMDVEDEEEDLRQIKRLKTS